MDYERRSDCWYNKVCQETLCDHCIRFLEMQHLLQTSGVPEIRQTPQPLIPDEKDYSAFLQLAEIKDHIAEVVEGGNFNLYLCSKNTGNGKTSWAIKILLKYFDQIWAGNGFRTRGLFIHVPTFLLKLKDFKNELDDNVELKLIPEMDLVVWDDIAVSDISKYDYNNLLMFLDNRILSGKANIFTSNRVNRSSLENTVGSRLASRIWDTSTRIILVGKDRRNG